MTTSMMIPEAFYRLLPLTATGVFALTFLFGLRVQRRLKSTDVMAAFQLRYDILAYYFRTEVEQGKHPIELLYARYWNLQMDQYQAWKARLISDPVYRYWMKTRQIEQSDLPQNEHYDARRGWEDFSRRYSDTDFVRFMNDVLDNKDLARLMAREKGWAWMPVLLR